MKVNQMTVSALLALTVFAGPVYSLGFGVNLGPFELGVDAGIDGGDYYRDGGYQTVVVPSRAVFEDPICYAIRNQRLVEVTVGFEEQVSDKERNFIVKRVTIEPYLLGRNQEGQPILRGNIISEKIVKSVNVKYGEDDKTVAPEEEKKGWFSGVFSPRSKDAAAAGTVSTVKLRRVMDINVVEQSHFDAPKDYGSVFKDDVYQVICAIPNTNKPAK